MNLFYVNHYVVIDIFVDISQISNASPTIEIFAVEDLSLLHVLSDLPYSSL